MQIPIFPLNGAVLYPETNLPLNIFEDRYVEMVDYALSNKRLIGMIQTNKKGGLFKIGCLGKITNFNETKDGRYLINLEGKSIFTTEKEIKKKDFKFRMVEISLIKYTPESFNFNLDFKKSLLDQFSKYINNKEIDLKIEELAKLNTKQLAKLIAMVSPFDYIDKQMLLEIRTPNEFCKKLLSILEIELFDQNKEKTIN
ncbi:MAG: Lon protease [Alphaproteobacteria bacterium MarineAlpha5_Bin5]|nr:MAG: Lon protease [Alphaproteobacteria bacterium MarineAlpha5_Bin5]PPR52700.1 MAG: Lon protease [Alphaproteobacteria bacterium MarineAlpha5_Bin4]|tara:strand:+ start:1209 stop:1805 length:597 start_codon:yes stop_codon:yes gene_type:complete